MKVTRKDGKIIEINLSEKELEQLVYQAVEQQFDDNLPALKGSTLAIGASLYFHEAEPQITHENMEI